MKSLIQKGAKELGFCKVGVTTAEAVDEYGHLADAVDSGRIAKMQWLARDVERRCDPKSLLPDAKSVICLAYPYTNDGIDKTGEELEVWQKLRRARYARGVDYHKFLMNKLSELWSTIDGSASGARSKFCVDTSPILEKALACRAGIGWIGKNTILLNENFGSWFLLGEIITDIEIVPDKPVADRCGDCRACLEACPTKAILEPYALDCNRCISYLTTVSKDEIPEELRGFVPEGTYGCDICQEICPYNARRT